MKRFFDGLLRSICLAAASGAATPFARAADFDPAAMRVVVSVRKFTPDDKHSYHHLFLYSGDGKIMRQLTDADGAHDFNPVFSPDGKQVVFQRNSPRVTDGGADGWYRIDDLERPSAVKFGGEMELPKWVHPKEDFNRIDDQGPPNYGTKGIDLDKPSTEKYVSPDGMQSLEMHYNWPTEAKDSDETRNFIVQTTIWLKDRSTSETLRVSKFPGFDGLGCAWLIGGSPFLFKPSMRIAFLECHRGSSYGEAIYALDLNRRVIHLMTGAGDGTIVPLSFEVPAFYCVCQELYQELGNGHTTVNCEYLDLWNADFKRTRFAPDLSDFGGAAVWIPGEKPLAIPIRYAPDK